MNRFETFAHCRTKRKRLTRDESGNFLVEAMVAVLVSSIIATGLVQMYCQVRRVGNMSQGHLLATAVAQECLDQLRGLPFTMVSANTGVHYAQVNGTGIADVLFPRPLLKDTNLDYTAGGDTLVSKGANYMFHTVNLDTGQNDDTVKVTVTNSAGAIPGLTISVSIRYYDTSGKLKTYTATSFITQNGVNS
jgi:hypothetical protein